MKTTRIYTNILYALTVSCSQSPFIAETAPKVVLDEGTFIGVRDGTTKQFNGIPFAQPPVGNLRFRHPRPVLPYAGTHHARALGPACIQQPGTLNISNQLPDATKEFLAPFTAPFASLDSEDCLTLNVIVPENATTDDKLPVAVWIYRGAFEVGSSAIPSFNGTAIVDRSITLGEPIIFVSMNYRVSALGFLGGAQVKTAAVGNLGLYDQREALRWTQRYIASFGGDPGRVTIRGESAGSISVASHMLTNGGNTEGLFHGAFMQSGSPLPFGDITKGQQYYDALVQDSGCAAADDTLECLRSVDVEVLRTAIAKSPSFWDYQSLALAWLPRTDGVFFEADPQQLVMDGSVANIPMVNGDCDDEGTLFALSALNITTDAEFEDYISKYYLKDIFASELVQALEAYPSNVTQGSPFDTGSDNAFTPQYKRVSAFIGDIFFQAPRRHFLTHRSSKQPTWSYQSKRFKSLPILGSAHSTDIENVFGGGDLADYFVNFVNHHDPNGRGGNITWPRYTPETPNMLTFLDGTVKETITQDTFRLEAMSTLTKLTLKHPI